jgi:hypothetical protein
VVAARSAAIVGKIGRFGVRPSLQPYRQRVSSEVTMSEPRSFSEALHIPTMMK